MGYHKWPEKNFITDDETPETTTQAAKLPITMSTG